MFRKNKITIIAATLICGTCGKSQEEPQRDTPIKLIETRAGIAPLRIEDFCFAQHEITPIDLEITKLVSQEFAPCFWSRSHDAQFSLVGSKVLSRGESCQLLDGLSGKTFDARRNAALLNQCHMSELIDTPPSNEDEYQKICVAPVGEKWDRLDQAYLGNLFGDYGYPIDYLRVSPFSADIYLSRDGIRPPFELAWLLDDLQPSTYKIIDCGD